MINNDQKNNEEIYERTLFAILCLQLAFEDIYNYLIYNTEDEIISFLEEFLDAEIMEKYTEEDDLASWVKQLKLNEDEGRFYKVCEFMECFFKAIAENPEKINDKDYKRFYEVLNVASITSVSDIKITSRAIRYDYEWEEEYKYYSVSENIEKSNSPNGWNKAKINKFKFREKEVDVNQFTEAFIKIIELLYEEKCEKFKKVRENAKEYGLETLFLGHSGEFKSEKTVKNTDIKIETKLNNNEKIKHLRTLIKALEFNENDLELYVKLARKKQ